MVNVTKENFIEQSNDLLQHLPQAAFVAIDEEMTGISVSTRERPSKDWTPAQRYSDLKQAPERYAMVQLGVALYFQNDEKDESTMDLEAGRGYASPASNAAAPYSVRRYNFYLFPEDAARDVVLNPATVAFLHQHGMSLDLWSRAGIPYTTTEHAEERLAFYQRQEVARRQKVSTSTPVSVQETVRHRIALTRTEDKTFHARAMAGLREWLDSPIPPPDAPPPPQDEEGAMVEPPDPLLHCSFLLPPCNSFLRRSLYESIQKEYPALELENGGNQQIRVWRLNEAEKAERHRRLRKDGWEALMGQKLGMWRVFAALRRVCSGRPLDPTSVLFASSYEHIDWDRIMAQSEPDTKEEEDIAAGRQMPLVVHNGFMDLCFLLTHFVSPQLPERYSECKQLISQHFPNIYDTKIMATECACWDGEAHESTASSTNLSNLFQLVVCDPHLHGPMTTTTERRYNILRDAIVVLPAVGSANANVVADQEHEAAFDAYMTGAIFIGLCLRIAARTPQLPKDLTYLSIIGSEEYRDIARAYYGRNKLYQMSIYTMDLEETRPDRDPLSKGMLSESTFRVAGIDKAVATRDIVQCLSGLRDAQGRVVNFVIVWVDDTTFLVAASYHPARPVWNEGATEDAPLVEQQAWKNDPTEAVLREHGVLLLEALRARFNQNETIVVLEDYLASLSEIGATSRSTLAVPPKSWFQRIWSLFGTPNQKRPSDETAAPSNKRRRVT